MAVGSGASRSSVKEHHPRRARRRAAAAGGAARRSSGVQSWMPSLFVFPLADLGVRRHFIPIQISVTDKPSQDIVAFHHHVRINAGRRLSAIQLGVAHRPMITVD
jgi:hypothetical protein